MEKFLKVNFCYIYLEILHPQIASGIEHKILASSNIGRHVFNSAIFCL